MLEGPLARDDEALSSRGCLPLTALRPTSYSMVFVPAQPQRQWRSFSFSMSLECSSDDEHAIIFRSR